jgi:hypothetical protein
MQTNKEKSAFDSCCQSDTSKNEINSNVDDVLSEVASKQDRKEAQSKKKPVTKVGL